jgi:hypothetical protein
MSEALGQQLGQVTAQLIAKNMNIAPTPGNQARLPLQCGRDEGHDFFQTVSSV